MKILAIESHAKSYSGVERLSAVDWWRTISPLKAVATKTGWTVDVLKGLTDFSILKNYDLIWFSYFDNILGYKEVVDSGVPFVINFDDDFLHLTKGNPVRRQYPPDSLAFRSIIHMIQHSPHLVVSTEHLARVYDKIRGEHLEKPVVLENRIDPYAYRTRKPFYNMSKVTIGWMGGATHYADIFFTSFWGALTYLCGKYPELRFEVMGLYSDADYSQLPNFKWTEGSVDHPTYAKQFEKWMRNIDICVAPLEDNLFNASKSSIKIQEYGVHGKPVVASSVRPYQEFMADSGLIDLADTHAEWVDALEKLITNRGYRESKGRKLQEFIENEYSVEKYVDSYVQYIESVVNNKPISRLKPRKISKIGSLEIVLGVRRFETLTGSELYYYELAREYLKLGHHVTVVALEAGGLLAKKITDLGGEAVSIVDADTLNPDVIISSHEPTQTLKEMFTCPIIQVVHSEHDLLWEIEKPVPGCTSYVAIRDEIKDRMVKEGTHPDLIHVIWNPIDLERFRPTGTSNRTLLFVGPRDRLREKVIQDVKDFALQKSLKPLFIGQGLENEPHFDIEKETRKCEMTASVFMGRTTLEGWACNKAGVIYQIDKDGQIISRRIVSPQDTELYDSKKVAQRILDLC